MDFFQHPSNNAVLGAPPNMSEEQCRALPITRITYEDGGAGVVSFWRPTPEELAKLNAGEPLFLMVWGVTHAPLYLGVGEPFAPSPAV